VTQEGSSLRKRDYKTLSIRFEPQIREIIEKAAEADKRSAASLVEIATLAYLREKGLLPK
jgi:hypothetical protein